MMHSVLLTISYDQVWFLIDKYSFAGIWDIIKKINENDKKKFFLNEKKKKKKKTRQKSIYEHKVESLALKSPLWPVIDILLGVNWCQSDDSIYRCYLKMTSNKTKQCL